MPYNTIAANLILTRRLELHVHLGLILFILCFSPNVSDEIGIGTLCLYVAPQWHFELQCLSLVR